MAKYCLKKPSKRLSCAKRYKIEKKVREHSRKLRKEAKKDLSKKGKNKPISVPNKCPFKEELLVEAEKERERFKLEKIENKKTMKKKRSDIAVVGVKRKLAIECGSLDELINKASKQGEDFSSSVLNNSNVSEKEKISAVREHTTKAYASEVHKTIESADVIIEVLDARDPLGGRSRSVEESVLNGGKRLILLLNKIDLVPKENVKKWINYLRKELPTVAFKASTQEQNQKLGRTCVSNLHTNSSKCIGADLVMKLLANYCRNKDVKESIRVGIVGYPNAGKSSVINSLKRKRVCNIGATPGVTRQLQEVQLDGRIRLLDSPGVVLASKNQLDSIEIALKNAVRIENLDDPIAPVQAILRRCSKENLLMYYEIPPFSTCDEFLVFISRKIGRLKKGARPDMNAAARKVLNDWNTGKLRYYTEPPEEINVDKALCSSILLDQFSKEFDLDNFNNDLSQTVDDLPTNSAMDLHFKYNPSVELEGHDEEMEVEEASRIMLLKPEKKKAEANLVMKDNSFPESFEIDGNSQLNRAIKLAVKRHKKKNKKHVKRTEAVIETMIGASLNDKNEDYDFSTLTV